MVYEWVVYGAAAAYSGTRGQIWSEPRPGRRSHWPWALLGVSSSISREFGEVLFSRARVDLHWYVVQGEARWMVNGRVPCRVLLSVQTVGIYVNLRSLVGLSDGRVRQERVCECLMRAAEQVGVLRSARRVGLLVALPMIGGLRKREVVEWLTKWAEQVQEEGIRLDYDVLWLAGEEGEYVKAPGWSRLTDTVRVGECLDEVLGTGCVACDVSRCL